MQHLCPSTPALHAAHTNYTHAACTCVSASTEHGVPGEAIAEAYDAFEKGQVLSPLAAAAVSNQTIQESMKLVLLVRAFQVGAAALKPLAVLQPLVPTTNNPTE